MCRDYCAENTNQCQTLLKTVCASKKPKDSAWSPICGCWYASSIYDNFYRSLEEKWNLPQGTYSTSPVCSFPECKENVDYQPKGITCPPTSIVTCLQNVSVDATGAALKNSPISVKQDTACKAAYIQKGGTRSCTSKTDCDSGQECTGGVCVTPPKKCTVATVATDCSSDEQCVAGQCEPKAVVPKKFPVWAILAIVRWTLAPGINRLLFVRQKENASDCR